MVVVVLGLGVLAVPSTASPAARASATVDDHGSVACTGYLPPGTVVGMAATPDDGGYWIASQDGEVVACGDAPDLGSLTIVPNHPIVGITATPSGKGFYLVATDGGVFSFGDALFQGSTGAITLNRPIVGMTLDRVTGGYWLDASDGGIFAFNAPFYGSTGAMTLNRPVVGMTALPSGGGYWLVASDGGIFAFNAPFLGSMGSVALNKPVVGMAPDPASNGYWLVASDGGIFAFDAPFLGSTGSLSLNRPIVGMESSASGSAYRFVASDGGVFTFGDGFYGSAVAPPPAGIQVGPGVLPIYTVQPQPAPGTCHYSYVGIYPLPDPNCTPGATSPQVPQATIDSTICVSGYTTSIRPPTGVTDAEKVGSAAAYGYTGSFALAEYDHLIPLELGGDPNDPANLWVEPNDRPNATSTYNSKDTLEGKLNSLVCSGQLTLAAAQQAIATDWVAAYQQYG